MSIIYLISCLSTCENGNSCRSLKEVLYLQEMVLNIIGLQGCWTIIKMNFALYGITLFSVTLFNFLFTLWYDKATIISSLIWFELISFIKQQLQKQIMLSQTGKVCCILSVLHRCSLFQTVKYCSLWYCKSRWFVQHIAKRGSNPWLSKQL